MFQNNVKLVFFQPGEQGLPGDVSTVVGPQGPPGPKGSIGLDVCINLLSSNTLYHQQNNP